ncbi:MAG: tRNA(fMet)-specific endonuclease VapC [Candidatus Bathyarchaeota archaeon BA2]|nr:MAG: tRNA(fMet)-specific endonuclease VapC [Candidatus Bathyarchaeota archaeon BA2]
MEEVVYDTSALINLLKSGKKIAKGFTTVFNVIEFPKALSLKELGVIYPIVEDYDEALKLSVSLLKVGKPLPAVDVLIASMCIRRGLTLLTLDEHFRHVKSVRKEFKIKVVK